MFGERRSFIVLHVYSVPPSYPNPRYHSALVHAGRPRPQRQQEERKKRKPTKRLTSSPNALLFNFFRLSEPPCPEIEDMLLTEPVVE